MSDLNAGGKIGPAVRLSAGDTFKKSLNLAQEHLPILFVVYGILFAVSAGLNMIPLVGTVMAQFLSTALGLSLFLQLRKILLGESQKLKFDSIFKVFQDSKILKTVVTYLLLSTAFFLPVVLIFGILYAIGAFTGTFNAPTFNPSMMVFVILGIVMSLAYILFFVLPSIMFALDLRIVKGNSLRDAFGQSLTAIYAHFWYITKLMILQLTLVLIGGIFYTVLAALFKENPSQVLILSIGSYVLLMIPTFIVLGCVRVSIFCAFFETNEPTAITTPPTNI